MLRIVTSADVVTTPFRGKRTSGIRNATSNTARSPISTGDSSGCSIARTSWVGPGGERHRGRHEEVGEPVAIEGPVVGCPAVRAHGIYPIDRNANRPERRSALR